MPRTRYIPSVDGLRAVSVMLVVVGHEGMEGLNKLPQGIARNGAVGVEMFFVISGFLITKLMLGELAKKGSLNLGRFYLRRAFRILPPLYVYLLVVGLLAAGGVIAVPVSDLVLAATCVYNYSLRILNWNLGHCWSLCVEEHFYLLWPLCLAYFSLQRAVKIAVWILLLSPFLRLFTYLYFRGTQIDFVYMSHYRADALMVGCFVALARELGIWGRALRFLGHWGTAAAAFVVLVLVSPYTANIFRQTLGFSLDAVCCASVFLYVVKNPESLPGKFLNTRVMKHIGVISYSLYLWQQLFEGPNTRWAPLNLLAVVCCAELSYWIVEKPVMRLRDRHFSRQVSPA